MVTIYKTNNFYFNLLMNFKVSYNMRTTSDAVIIYAYDV